MDRRTGITRRRFLRYGTMAGMGLAFGGGLAACGDGAGTDQTGTTPGDTAAPGTGAGELQQVSFLIDVTPYGKHALFFAPLALGYWEENGLAVEIQSAQGSGDNVSKIGAKAADFGFADAGALILGRSQGAGVREICMIHYRNLMAAIGLDDNPIEKPQDLEGKQIGATTGDAGRVLFPAFAQINGIDSEAVEFITVEQLAKPAILTEGEIDGALDFFTSFPAYERAAEEREMGVTHFLYADHGMDLYNNGIIAHEDLLESDPDLVRRFVDGVVRGVVWTVENPDEATDLLIEQQPGLSKEVARAQLQVAIEHLMVDEVRENGVGPMSEDKMAFTVETISENFELESPVAVEEVYTNDFVEAGSIPDV
jgi:NitT/TauT family transport system substrate-binding protein